MREIRCLTAAYCQYRQVLVDADRIAEGYPPCPNPIDPVDEIAARLPQLLATLSPAARALMWEQTETVGQAAAAMQQAFGSARHLEVVSG